MGRGFSFKVICSDCGKVTAGRLPRSGKHRGDGTFYFPRQHDKDGKPCAGNIQEGIIVDVPKSSH